jgi:hypothetical protein
MSAAEVQRRCAALGRRVGHEDAAFCWTHATAAWLGTPEGRAAVARWGERGAVAEHAEALVLRAVASAVVL